MHSLAVVARCLELRIQAGRGGLRQKGETQLQKTPSSVVRSAHSENSADLLVVGCAAAVHAVVVEAEGAVVEGDSGIPPKSVNLARAVVTALVCEWAWHVELRAECHKV